MNMTPRLVQITCTIALSGLAATSAFAQTAALTGKVRIDGSSTVAPISTAAAEMFRGEQPRVQVTVGTSGTGGGFKKFLESNAALRADINDASRPIKPEELSAAVKLGIEIIELPIAYDGIAIVAHPSNKFCDHLSVEELKRVWEPDSKIKNWKDVRPGFPDLVLKLYGPGPDSGTFDYFTEAINGKQDASRSDFTASENDNVLVRGVEGDPGSLGYFGFSYYEANKSKLKLLGVARGDGKPVLPSVATIFDGSYSPLSRPLFLYVNRTAADRPEVMAFLEFYLKNGKKIVEHPKVNYVALSAPLYESVLARLKSKVAGSLYADPAAHGTTLEALFGKQK